MATAAPCSVIVPFTVSAPGLDAPGLLSILVLARDSVRLVKLAALAARLAQPSSALRMVKWYATRAAWPRWADAMQQRHRWSSN